MGKYKFNPCERYAVFTAHGEKCWLCRKPLDLASMQVDHIVPESLADKPQELAHVLRDLGLPGDFDLQSHENWLPICGPCNLTKLAEVFEPTPLIQLCLRKARDKASRARELEAELVRHREVAEAWNIIERAALAGSLAKNIENAIGEFGAFSVPKREPELANEPLRLAPLIQILSEENGIRIAKGPYGTGGGPINPTPAAMCSCGHALFSGARCVVCGEMGDF